VVKNRDKFDALGKDEKQIGINTIKKRPIEIGLLLKSNIL
jgi:hypothetical protein